MMQCVVCNGMMVGIYGGSIEGEVVGHQCTNCHSLCDHEIMVDDTYECWELDEWDADTVEGVFCTIGEFRDPWLWTYDPDPRPICPACWGESRDWHDWCSTCSCDGVVHRETFSDYVTKRRRVGAMSIYGIRKYFDMLRDGILER